MSNDNPWDSPNQPPNKPPSDQGVDGWGEPRLPGPGESWDDVEPQRPAQPDMNWGTAGPDLPPGPPPGNFGPPGQFNPPGRSPFGPPPGPPPGGAPFGGPMVHSPGTSLTPANGQLDQNDIIALVVSAFFPGVGHLMLGQATKGIAILVTSFFTCGGFGLLWVFALIDTYFLALARKKRQIGEWEFLPK